MYNTNNLIGDDDYQSGPYSVSFPAGVTRVSFNISIYNDDVWEDSEKFTLTINAESLPDGIIIGSPSTVIIRNDDGEYASYITSIMYNVVIPS